MPTQDVTFRMHYVWQTGTFRSPPLIDFYPMAAICFLYSQLELNFTFLGQRLKAFCMKCLVLSHDILTILPHLCYLQVRNTVNRFKERRKALNFSVSLHVFFFRICMFCPQVLNHTPTQASSIQPMSSSSPGLHVSNPAEARPFTLNCQASIYTRGCCWRGSLSFTKAV